MTDNKIRPTNVLIVGVGGQGVIMISKVLAQLCQNLGYDVKQSEVHGMAKRGGGVFSHVRFGPAVWSPTIPEGEADILLALEWAEGLRWLNYMYPETGTFIADTQRIVPPLLVAVAGAEPKPITRRKRPNKSWIRFGRDMPLTQVRWQRTSAICGRQIRFC